MPLLSDKSKTPYLPEIKGFIETSFIDWRGRVCSVLFLGGCNFRCPFCHNHPLVTAPAKIKSFDFGVILEKLLRYKKWLGGVCISGGEPTLSPALFALLRTLRSHGFNLKLDTNGTRPDIIATLLDEGLLDMISMDVKAPLTAEKYEACAGADVDLAKIKRSISIIKAGNIAHEFRMTVLPKFHNEADICTWAEELGSDSYLKIQNFNPASTLDESLKNERPFTPEAFTGLQEIISNKIAIAPLDKANTI